MTRTEAKPESGKSQQEMKKEEKPKVGKYRCMIRTKDLTDRGCEIVDEKSKLLKWYNEVEGLLIIDLGLFYELKNNNGFKKVFKYSESTIRKKLRLDYWKKQE